jgi:hypothetical protein
MKEQTTIILLVALAYIHAVFFDQRRSQLCLMHERHWDDNVKGILCCACCCLHNLRNLYYFRESINPQRIFVSSLVGMISVDDAIRDRPCRGH